ncbi:MAG: PIN domain-containing protein [Verrucomicrobiales bacterium]
MDANPVLVDSSYYISRSKSGHDVLQELAFVAASRDLATCGMVRCEVGRGISQPKVLQLFRDFWDVMVFVPTDNQLWEVIERTAWRLTRQGNNLPLADIMIACCAQSVGATVLTFDSHFSTIPGLKVARTLAEL